jgi:hypothetical protein
VPDSERDRLFRQVRYGHLSPGEAEELLKTRGLKPFEERPDPSNFDPMTAEEWTLAMAAAWFTWRSIDAVRDQWDPARKGWRKWVPLPHLSTAGPPRPRWQLKRFGAATLADVFEQARLPGSSSRNTTAARPRPISGGSPARTHNPYDRLKVALQTGRLQATWGSRRESGFEAISADYWLREFDAEANPKRNVATRPSNSNNHMSVAFRFSPSPAKRNKKINKVEFPDPSNLDPFDLPDLSQVEPAELPIPLEDEANANALRPAAQPEETESPPDASRQQDAGEFHREDLDEIVVLREDVKRVEREVSHREYEGEDWGLGQALAWIAYQHTDTFRSLWETDLHPVPTYYGISYPPDFPTIDPPEKLRDFLILGRLSGFVAGDPIASADWLEKQLWDCPEARFRRADVVKLRVKPDTSAGIKNKVPTIEELKALHEDLERKKGKPIGENEFYEPARSIHAPHKLARSIHKEVGTKTGDPGPKGPRKAPTKAE